MFVSVTKCKKGQMILSCVKTEILKQTSDDGDCSFVIHSAIAILESEYFSNHPSLTDIHCILRFLLRNELFAHIQICSICNNKFLLHM